MDDIVLQAMMKWPDVPACFGWLRLDARGQWRMRDERAQQLDLPGDKIAHPALLGFINRNYASDEQGRWYFQNGPQRVYVDLELLPYIVRTDPAIGLLLHTGQAMATPTQAWLTTDGQLLLQTRDSIAAVDDRDGDAVLASLYCHGMAVNEQQLLNWLDGSGEERFHWHFGTTELVVQRIDRGELPQHFHFVMQPRALRLHSDAH